MRESRAGRIYCLLRSLIANVLEADDVRNFAWTLTRQVREVCVRRRDLEGRQSAATYVAAVRIVDFFHGRFLYLLL